MEVKITVKIPPKLLKLKQTLKAANQDAIREFLPVASSEVKARTQKGQSVTGGSFAAYSPKYAKRRQKKGLSINPVNLTVSGSMLRFNTSQQNTEGQTIGRVSVPDSAEVYAKAHNQGDKKMPKREFMGLGKQLRDRFKVLLTKKTLDIFK